MKITDRIKRSIQNRRDLVFRPRDFFDFGSEASIKRALKELTRAGVLVRLGAGIYAKAKPSVISGKPIPIRPLEVLIPVALSKLGVRVKESAQIFKVIRAFRNQCILGDAHGYWCFYCF